MLWRGGLSGEYAELPCPSSVWLRQRSLALKKCIVPKVCLAGVSHISGIEIVGVANIKEAIEAVR